MTWCNTDGLLGLLLTLVTAYCFVEAINTVGRVPVYDFTVYYWKVRLQWLNKFTLVSLFVEDSVDLFSFESWKLIPMIFSHLVLAISKNVFATLNKWKGRSVFTFKQSVIFGNWNLSYLRDTFLFLSQSKDCPACGQGLTWT